MAEKLSDGLVQACYKLIQPVESNQIFVVLANDVIKMLQEQFAFFVISDIDKQNSMIRLVTSWATDEVLVNEFVKAIGINIFYNHFLESKWYTGSESCFCRLLITLNLSPTNHTVKSRSSVNLAPSADTSLGRV